MLLIMQWRRITPQGESPQLTHFWNNMLLPRSAVAPLDRHMMVHCKGDPEAIPRRSKLDVRFHLGGWPTYVVLEPELPTDEWYVGWIGNTIGVSRIPISRRVRMLIGPNDVDFFGVKAGDRSQIKLRQLGGGRFGVRGPFSKDPLH